MYYLEISLFVIGVALLIVGYRRNRRNVMLVAAILLYLSGAVGDFVKGVQEGYLGTQDTDSPADSAQHPAPQ